MDDRKYNGEHDCPRCGHRSNWKASETLSPESPSEKSSLMITVECTGGCQHYEMAYEQMHEFPHFAG
jgi:hypothetical protein